jgi:anti-sigma factor RsiW
MTPPIDDFPCNEFVEVVTDYLDGAMSADDTRRLEEHLAVCPGCQRVLDQFRTIISITGLLAEHDIDALTEAQRAPLIAVFREWALNRS